MISINRAFVDTLPLPNMASISYKLAGLAPWPIANMIKYSLAPKVSADAEPAATRFRVAGPVMTSPVDHIMLILTCGWKFIFALVVYYWFPIDLAAARRLDVNWIISVALRDLAITYAVGLWDIVNLSPLSPVYEKMKARRQICFSEQLLFPQHDI